jgi:hypothetical protein
VTSAVHKRRKQVGRLLRYLFGRGWQEEHVDPHLIAVWQGAGDLASLEPPTGRDGIRDIRRRSSGAMPLMEAAFAPVGPLDESSACTAHPNETARISDHPQGGITSAIWDGLWR